MRKLKLATLSSFVIAAMLLGACQPTTTPAASNSPTAAAASPVPATDVPAPTDEPMEPTAVSGGGGDDNCAEEDVWCVGFVTDVGEIDDKSFNQSGWEGVQSAAENYGAVVNFVETKDAKDYETNIRLFGDKSYDIIVTSGFGLGEMTGMMADEYPEIHFIGIDQFQAEEKPNYVGLIFHEDQAGFLAGALAAQLSKSGKVAAVLGTDLIPPVVAFGDGFINGAKYINEDIDVVATYHPGGLDVAFTDPEWGASTARQALDQGADVIFGAGGKTGNGALIETAGMEDVYCIGVDTDQWETVPEAHPCLVSSAMKLIEDGVTDLISQIIDDGQAPTGNYFGPVGLAPFHDFDGEISDEIKAKLTEIDEQLKDGSLETGYTP